MRRRRLFNLAVGGAAAASLVVCVATAALWGITRTRTFYIAYGRGETSYQLRSAEGIIRIGRVMLPDWEQRQGLAAGRDSALLDFWMSWPSPTLLNRIGFGLVADGSTRRGAPWDVRILMVPHWAIILASGLVAIRAAFRSRSARGAICATCGYDLRATPDRCPECGADVVSRPLT